MLPYTQYHHHWMVKEWTSEEYLFLITKCEFMALQGKHVKGMGPFHQNAFISLSGLYVSYSVPVLIELLYLCRCKKCTAGIFAYFLNGGWKEEDAHIVFVLEV